MMGRELLSGSCAAELSCGKACKSQCAASEEGKGGRLRNRRRDRRPGEGCEKHRRPRSRSAEGEIRGGVGKAGSRKSGDAGEVQRASDCCFREGINGDGYIGEQI